MPLQDAFCREDCEKPATSPGYWKVPWRDETTHDEARLPLRALACNTSAASPPPSKGALWRINFSRVEWRVAVNAKGAYVKDPPTQSPSNWVWAPMGVVDMHLPERWGYVQFADGEVNATAPRRDPDWPLRYVASALYDAQAAFREDHGRYASQAELPALAARAPAGALDGRCASVAIALAREAQEYAAEIEMRAGAGGAARAACVASDRLRSVYDARGRGAPLGTPRAVAAGQERCAPPSLRPARAPPLSCE